MNDEHCLELLKTIADQAELIAMNHFRSPGLSVIEKLNAGPVTSADIEIEAMARKIIDESHCGLGVLGEEFGENAGIREGRLIIDPIDATENFVRGIPLFATLLAVEIQGEIRAGLVSAPALSTRWFALRGQGAYRGLSRLSVSKVKNLERAHLFHSDISDALRQGLGQGFLDLVKRTGRQRGFGDFYQHVLVAEGAGDVAIDFDTAAWDVAPLQITVEEAGGMATSLDGSRTYYGGNFITSNGLLHTDVIASISSK